jgi:uncharacterized protein
LLKNRKYPSYEECIRILRENKCSPSVQRHTIAVYELALKIAAQAIADNARVNLELIKSGALLHDLGRSRTHGIKHAIEGAKLARRIGLPKELVDLIEHHIGAGVSKEEAKGLGLLPKDYSPRTTEEKIIAHADNLIVGLKKRKIKEIANKLESKGLREVASKVLALHQELSELCGIDLDKIEMK